MCPDSDSKAIRWRFEAHIHEVTGHTIILQEELQEKLPMEGLEGKRVRVTVEVEQTCSCGAKTFDRSGMCYKCEQDEAYFEANYS